MFRFAGAMAAVLLGNCVMAGQSWSQGDTSYTLRRQQEMIRFFEARIDGIETEAVTALMSGRCSDFSEARRKLAQFGQSLRTSSGGKLLSPLMISQLAARAEQAYASLPPPCDPDPYIRTMLEREQDCTRDGGSDGDAQ